MTWVGVISAINTNLETAAASASIPLVRQGEPDNLNTDCIYYEYAGDRESRTGGNTLTKTNVEERVRVTVLLRGSVRATAIDSSLEVRLRDAARACKAALWGDWSLGGNCIGLSVDDTETGWVNIGDQLARFAAFDLLIDLAEVDTIAP